MVYSSSCGVCSAVQCSAVQDGGHAQVWEFRTWRAGGVVSGQPAVAQRQKYVADGDARVEEKG